MIIKIDKREIYNDVIMLKVDIEESKGNKNIPLISNEELDRVRALIKEMDSEDMEEFNDKLMECFDKEKYKEVLKHYFI